MAESINLTTEEMRYIDKPKVGEAIVKMNDRFSEPIHVGFPLVSVREKSNNQTRGSF